MFVPTRRERRVGIRPVGGDGCGVGVAVGVRGGKTQKTLADGGRDCRDWHTLTLAC